MDAAKVEAVCARLADGESLSAICRDKDMPSWGAIHNWMNDDPEVDGQVTRAREAGYHKRAEEAVIAAKTAEDASKGRLAFDAERWYLGKLSNAFNDKQKLEHSGPNGKPIETAFTVEFVRADGGATT